MTKSEIFSWENQCKQYPMNGHGLMYYRAIIRTVSVEKWVNCLLYYNNEGELVGILNHYPFNFKYEQKGNVNIQIKPEEKRKGIATILLNEAIKEYKVNLNKQHYTDEGLLFIQSFIERRHRKKHK